MMILLKSVNDTDFLPEESENIFKHSYFIYLNSVWIEINAAFFICSESFMSAVTVLKIVYWKISKKQRFYRALEPFLTFKKLVKLKCSTFSLSFFNNSLFKQISLFDFFLMRLGSTAIKI